MSKFKITKETQGSNQIPIPAPRELDKTNHLYPRGYEFPIVNLVKVQFDSEKMVKNRDTGTEVPTPVLIFVFKDDKKRIFTHIEFPLKEDDEKFDTKLTALNNRIKHIWDETIGADRFPEDAIGGETFADFFKSVANAFNSITVTSGEGESAKTRVVYPNTKMYFKSVYYKDNQQLPMYPNFLQRAFIGANQIACDLIINVSRDSIKPQAKAQTSNTSNFGAHNNDFGGYGDFDAGFADIPQQ